MEAGGRPEPPKGIWSPRSSPKQPAESSLRPTNCRLSKKPKISNSAAKSEPFSDGRDCILPNSLSGVSNTVREAARGFSNYEVVDRPGEPRGQGIGNGSAGNYPSQRTPAQSQSYHRCSKKNLGNFEQSIARDQTGGGQQLMSSVQELSIEVGQRRACQVLGMPRSSFYRTRQPKPPSSRPPKPSRSLSQEEEKEVLSVLHEPRFVDHSPATIWATLLDESRYYCSVRTMYRILHKHQEVKERRNQLRHPKYQKPELLAKKPNEVWTWDITELRGPAKHERFYLYVILDLFSRYVVGWMVAQEQSSRLAKQLITQSVDRQQILPEQLTIHSDRGPAMTAKPTVCLLADLGIIKSVSRPYCSNDNPFIESHFRTLKYRPQFPSRFGSLVDARQFCTTFFTWYNQEHRHSGIGWMTPHTVHFELTEPVRRTRQSALDEAYNKNKNRFINRQPKAPEAPPEVWINPPEKKAAEETPSAPQGQDQELNTQENQVHPDPAKKRGSQSTSKRLSETGQIDPMVISDRHQTRTEPSATLTNITLEGHLLESN